MKKIFLVVIFNNHNIRNLFILVYISYFSSFKNNETFLRTIEYKLIFNIFLCVYLCLFFSIFIKTCDIKEIYKFIKIYKSLDIDSLSLT